MSKLRRAPKRPKLRRGSAGGEIQWSTSLKSTTERLLSAGLIRGILMHVGTKKPRARGYLNGHMNCNVIKRRVRNTDGKSTTVTTLTPKTERTRRIESSTDNWRLSGQWTSIFNLTRIPVSSVLADGKSSTAGETARHGGCDSLLGQSSPVHACPITQVHHPADSWLKGHTP